MSSAAARSRVPGVTDHHALAQDAAAELAALTGVERHDIALVLGSGWLPAVDALGAAHGLIRRRVRGVLPVSRA